MTHRNRRPVDPEKIAVIEHLTGQPFAPSKPRRSAAQLASIAFCMTLFGAVILSLAPNA